MTAHPGMAACVARGCNVLVAGRYLVCSDHEPLLSPIGFAALMSLRRTNTKQSERAQAVQLIMAEIGEAA